MPGISQGVSASGRPTETSFWPSFRQLNEMDVSRGVRTPINRTERTTHLTRSPKGALLASAVLRIKSNVSWNFSAKSLSPVLTNLSAPSLIASTAFEGECEKTVTSAPKALAN